MKYRAKPVEVNAYVIERVSEPDPANGSRVLLLSNAAELQATHVADAPMLARYTPVPGDYLVVQADGYRYINPKDVFERKYSPAE
jgi:hypothetical protein